MAVGIVALQSWTAVSEKARSVFAAKRPSLNRKIAEAKKKENDLTA